MMTAAGAGLLGMMTVMTGRYEPASAGSVAPGSCGVGRTCWAKLAAQTSMASVRLEMVRAIMSAHAEQPLQRLLKMSGQGGLCGVCIPHSASSENIHMFAQCAYGQRLRREPIEPDQCQVILESSGRGFDERIAQVESQRTM